MAEIFAPYSRESFQLWNNTIAAAYGNSTTTEVAFPSGSTAALTVPASTAGAIFQKAWRKTDGKVLFLWAKAS